MIAATLKERGFNCAPFAELLLACKLLDRGVGVLLIAEEALFPASTEALGGFIRNQPSWSELPIIILAAGGLPSDHSAQMLSVRQPLGIVLVLERPIRQETLIAAVASSIQSRKRQYQLRAQLEALRESEKQFRALADSVPNLAWTAHANGYIHWYNQRWFDYTGTTPEQMQGWGWQSVHDPKLLPFVLERWLTSINTGQPFEMEFPLLGADGEFRWFLTRVVPIKDSNGNVLQWFGTNTDVDELRGTEQALRESQEQLTLALVASGTGTFRWEPLSARFLLFGDNLRSLFGLEFPDEIRNLEDFIARIHPEDRANVLTAMTRGEQSSDLETEFRVLLADGSVRWLYVRGKMVTNADGHPLYLVGACTDITEAKLARQALYKSEKLAAAGRLAATVAHEINNPLAAVTNILYLLRTCESRERAQDYIDMADQELRRIAHIRAF